MARVVADGEAAGVDGVLVTPGPDLVWLTGYQPTAITERLTVLVLTTDREPTLLVPTLERPDAEARRRHRRHHPRRLARRRRPVRRGERAAASRRSLRDLRRRVGDAPARPPDECCRARRTTRMTTRLPMLRAVKDANELARLEAAGAAADATYERDPGRAVLRAEGDRRGRRPRRAAARARSRAGRLHGRRVGTQRRQPAPRGRRPDHRGRRLRGARLRRADVRLRLGHQPHRLRRRAVRRDPRGARGRALAQQAGVDAVRPGVACQEIDRAARA